VPLSHAVDQELAGLQLLAAYGSVNRLRIEMALRVPRDPEASRLALWWNDWFRRSEARYALHQQLRPIKAKAGARLLAAACDPAQVRFTIEEGIA
jgi:hypothetical protein